MLQLDTKPAMSVASLLEPLRDIKHGVPEHELHIYSTTAFTQTLATACGGWMPVAVKTQGITRAKHLIGEFLHENYPRLFISPNDWSEGTIDLNFEVNQNCAATIRMDPHDMPFDVVLPTGNFRRRSEFYDSGDNSVTATHHDGEPGRVPDPPPSRNLDEAPTGKSWDYRPTDLPQGGRFHENRTLRCPWCFKAANLRHGDSVKHDGHTMRLRGAVVQMTPTATR